MVATERPIFRIKPKIFTKATFLTVLKSRIEILTCSREKHETAKIEHRKLRTQKKAYTMPFISTGLGLLLGSIDAVEHRS
jgi:hypothetical protein